MKKSNAIAQVQFVVKHNDLIQHSRYVLNLEQFKILSYMISKIKPTDKPETVYEITIKDYCVLTNKDAEAPHAYYYNKVKASIKSIADASVWIMMEDGRETLFRWLDEVEIYRRSGKIRYTFHKSIAPYLFQLSEYYTMYYLYIILPMEDIFAIRLYDYLKSIEHMMRPDTLTLEKFRRIIGCDKYPEFKDFRRRIMDRAIDEINKYADIKVIATPNKVGKSYKSITLNILPLTSNEFYMRARAREKALENNLEVKNM